MSAAPGPLPDGSSWFCSKSKFLRRNTGQAVPLPEPQEAGGENVRGDMIRRVRAQGLHYDSGWPVSAGVDLNTGKRTRRVRLHGPQLSEEPVDIRKGAAGTSGCGGH